MPDYFNMPSIFDLPTPQRRPRQAAPELPPPTQEETESLLSRIGAGAVHGLSYIGGSLSKATGGRAIRGLIGGRPEELLSLIPFSDTLGITNPAHEVRGSDLLGGDENTSFFSPQGLAGFGLDVALDPATWLGPGLIAKGYGAVARGVGKVGTKLPLVGGQLEAAGTAAKNLYQRTIPPLFEKAVMGIAEPRLQPIAREASAAMPQAQALARTSMEPIKQELLNLADLSGHTRGTAEYGNELMRLGRELKMTREGNLPAGMVSSPGMQRANQLYGQLAGEDLQGMFEHGLADLPTAAPGSLDYLHRQAAPGAVEPFVLNPGGGKLSPAGEIARKAKFMEPVQVPVEGPSSLNELSMRADLAAKPPPAAQQEILESYLKVSPAEQQGAAAARQKLAAGQQLQPLELQNLKHVEAATKQAEQLQRWNYGLDHAELSRIGGFFPNHPLADLEEKLVRDAGRFLKADATHKAVAELAEPAAALGRNGVPLADVLQQAGMAMSDASGVRPQAMAATVDELLRTGKIAQAGQEAGLAIHKDMVPYVTKFLEAGSSPEGLKPLLSIWDSITNMTRSFQTAFWPASKARNQMTAMTQNWFHNAYDPALSGPASYIKPWLDAKRWRDGEIIPGISQIPDYAKRGLTDAQASAEFAKEVYAWNVQKNVGKQSQEFIGRIGDSGVKNMPVVGTAQKPLAQITGEHIPRSWEQANPLATRGAWGHTEDVFAPVKAGRELDTALDDINRVSVYLAKRKQGLEPLQAFQDTIAAHYDFDNLSNFERNVVRRFVPFYSWARQNIPAVVTELVSNPGGKMAQSLRAMTEMAPRQQGFVPDYMGSGMTVPVGERSPEGQQTFLASMGLPVEDVANLTQPGNFLGMLNPLLKAPLEHIANRNFFTGRELTGTVPHTGNRAGDELLAASPLGRFATTYRHLTDPRSSMAEALFNLASPGRLSNVDVGTAARQQMRQQAEEMLMANPAVRRFSRVYVRPEDMPNLSSTERALLGLYQRSQQGGQP